MSGVLNLGRTLNLLGQHDAAEAALAKACGALQRLVEASPDDLNYRSTLGGALNNLGLAHERAGRLDEALSAYRSAVEHQQAARDAALDVQQIGEFLAKSQENLRRVQALMEHDHEDPGGRHLKLQSSPKGEQRYGSSFVGED